MAEPQALPDPSPRLNAAFARIRDERMRGLPISNPALRVEAVGFAPWNGRWLGVMVTPWSINLMLLPCEPSAWRPLAPGAKRRYRFPAGDYDFVGASEEGVGEYHVCSLFSPPSEFADQETARFVAVHARAALLDAANAPGAPARMTKRDFLRAPVAGMPHDD